MLAPLAQLRRIRRGYRRYARRYVSAALLVPVTIVVTGVPIPSAPATKSAERFPCEACHCGCASAEQCWLHCCCHSLAERLAWARANNVRPPDFALAEARWAGLNVTDWIPGGDCCKSPSSRICSADRSEPDAERSCCNHRQSATVATSDRAACCASSNVASTAAPTSDYVVAWRALACHGQSFESMAAVPMLISTRLELTGELPFAYWLPSPASSVAVGNSPLPPVPPPERV